MSAKQDATRTTIELQSMGEKILALAKKYGATEADVVLSRSTEFDVKVSNKSIENLTQATSKGFGLRAFVGKRQGFCASSDFTQSSLEQSVERAVALAKEAAEDPHNGLAETEPGLIEVPDDMELYDSAVMDLPAEQKIDWAHAIEAEARKTHPSIQRFRDSGVSSGESATVLMNSQGAIRTNKSTGVMMWCIPIAVDEEGNLQLESWSDSATFLEDLPSPESIGKKAAERAARMVGAKPVKSQRVPVIYEPRMAAGLMAGILGAVNGDMVYKGASFLGEKLGEQIAGSNINLYDDPFIKRGSGSTAFDGEGLKTYKKAIVENGLLKIFLYDIHTARKAGVESTANAKRGFSSPPSAGPFNFYLTAGSDDPQEMIRSCDKAFIMTRGLGRGVNTVTGEYSRGANGLWVENGEVVHAVQEVTIAGDFLQMLQNIDRLGNDFEMAGSSGAPSLRISEMAIGGRG